MSFSQGKFDVYTRGLRCKNINLDYLDNMKCQLKARRGHKGLIFVSTSFKKPIEHPMVIFIKICHCPVKRSYVANSQLYLRLFWRASNTRYEPYIIDNHIDICNVRNWVGTQNPLVKFLFQCFSKLLNPDLMNAVKNGCPIMV